mmetsp:Transcript_25510/g.59406  ORF Transcript_25510/g.59406 Transcript_25510/m.59406 type:complete len:979 (+) Transcript_25510:73-3009(+)
MVEVVPGLAALENAPARDRSLSVEGARLSKVSTATACFDGSSDFGLAPPRRCSSASGLAAGANGASVTSTASVLTNGLVPGQPRQSVSPTRTLPAPVRGGLVPNRFANMTPKAASVLKQIEQVVADMEQDLRDDFNAPRNEVREPGPSMSMSQARAVEVSGDRTLDWLDSSIQAMEQWQKTCNKRKAKLNQLRQIVDGQVGVAVGEAGPRSDRARGERLASHAGSLKAKVQELQREIEDAQADKKDLARSLQEVELDCQTALGRLRDQEQSVGRPGLRSQDSSRSASERVASAQRELDIWQKKLAELGATAARDRTVCEEAEAALATAESYLKPLEDNSRAVLEDCRALQRRVVELENENAILITTKASFEDERGDLLRRIQVLTSQRSELEDMRNILVDETYSQSVQHNDLVQQRSIEAMQAAADLNRQERRLKVQLEELRAQLSALEVAKAKVTSVGEQQHARDMETVRNLELQLEALHKDGLAQGNALRIKIQELESEVSRSRLGLQDYAPDKRKMEELERELAATRSEIEALSSKSRTDQKRVRDLQSEIDSLQLKLAAGQDEYRKGQAALAELEQRLAASRERDREMSRDASATTRQLQELQLRIEQEHSKGQRVAEATKRDLQRVSELEVKLGRTESEIQILKQRITEITALLEADRSDEEAREIIALEESIRQARHNAARFHGLMGEARQRMSELDVRHEEITKVTRQHKELPTWTTRTVQEQLVTQRQQDQVSAARRVSDYTTVERTSLSVTAGMPARESITTSPVRTSMSMTPPRSSMAMEASSVTRSSVGEPRSSLRTSIVEPAAARSSTSMAATRQSGILEPTASSARASTVRLSGVEGNSITVTPLRSSLAGSPPTERASLLGSQGININTVSSMPTVEVVPSEPLPAASPAKGPPGKGAKGPPGKPGKGKPPTETVAPASMQETVLLPPSQEPLDLTGEAASAPAPAKGKGKAPMKGKPGKPGKA